MTATEEYLDSLDPEVDWVKWPILVRADEEVASVDHIYALPSTSITPHWHLVTEGLEKRELGMFEIGVSEDAQFATIRERSPCLRK